MNGSAGDKRKHCSFCICKTEYSLRLHILFNRKERERISDVEKCRMRSNGVLRKFSIFIYLQHKHTYESGVVFILNFWL